MINLTNGVIDGIVIDPSAIRSFKLNEHAKSVPTWFPGSGSAVVLLMNNDTYNGLSEEKRAWIDAVASDELSRGGGATYDKVAGAGLKLA